MDCLAPRPPKTGQTVNGDTLRGIDAKSKGRPRDGRVKKQKTPGANYLRRLHFTETDYRLTDSGTGVGYCSLLAWTSFALVLFKSCLQLAANVGKCARNLRTVIGLHSQGVRGIIPPN